MARDGYYDCILTDIHLLHTHCYKGVSHISEKAVTSISRTIQEVDEDGDFYEILLKRTIKY